jgi:thiamine pyrophosphate-dependent acetolactate synthase large subunit-like protein
MGVSVFRQTSCAATTWSSMGFAVPGALGVQIASGRRPLVLVGDGAFQMTGSEIAHAGQYGCNPIIEVGWARGDVSPILRGFVEAFKNRVHREAGAHR